MIGRRNKYTGEIVTIDDLFVAINNSATLKHKLGLIISKDQQGVYLGNEFMNYAKEYDKDVVSSKK